MARRSASIAAVRVNDLRHASTTRRSGAGGLKGTYSSSESRLVFCGTDVIGSTVTPRPEPTMCRIVSSDEPSKVFWMPSADDE